MSRLIGIPVDDLKGFVLVAVDVNDQPSLLTSGATYRTVVSVLLETVAHVIDGHQLDDPTTG